MISCKTLKVTFYYSPSTITLRRDFCFLFCFGFLTPSSTTRLYRGRSQDWRLAILRAATHETEWGDHDFCLSRSQYTDTDPTSRGAGGNGGNRTQDLLTGYRALYLPSYRAPLRRGNLLISSFRECNTAVNKGIHFLLFIFQFTFWWELSSLFMSTFQALFYKVIFV